MSNLFRVEPPANPSPSVDNVIADTKLLRKTVGWTCKNLFDPTDIQYEHALFGTEGSGAYIDTSTGGLTYIAAVENDTEYTVSKKSGVGNDFIVAGFTTAPTIHDTPSSGGGEPPVITPDANSEILVSDSSLTTYTFDSESYNYIAFTVNKGSGDSHIIVQTAEGMIYDGNLLDTEYDEHHKSVEDALDDINDEITNLPRTLLDYFYPVGTIYQTTKSSSEWSPTVAWGGVWANITERFLIGAGASYQVGDIGGEREHTLTILEIPSHYHDIYLHDNDSSGLVTEVDAQSALHPESQLAETTITGTTGGGQAHNNMPPYLAVTMWKRIS